MSEQHHLTSTGGGTATARATLTVARHGRLSGEYHLSTVVARQYDVNANQVFAWRRRFCVVTEVATPALVPVTITPELEEKPTPAVSDTIEIEVGGDCRVRVGSNFDGRMLKRVLDVLRKR